MANESGIFLNGSTPAATVCLVGYIKGLKSQLDFLIERKREASQTSIKNEIEAEIRRILSEFNHSVARLATNQGVSLTVNEFTIINVADQDQPTNRPTNQPTE